MRIFARQSAIFSKVARVLFVSERGVYGYTSNVERANPLRR